MYILGGKLKKRKVEVPAGVRPVSQRVKKSCFDIMSGGIAGRSVLDIYAGSGALGIEALSRKAKKAVFIDKNRKHTAVISRNISNLSQRGKAEVYCRDAATAIKDFYSRGNRFDVIFLDPPYYKGLLTKSLQLLAVYDILARSGYIIGFCYQNEVSGSSYGAAMLVLQRVYGQSVLRIYKKKAAGRSKDNK